MFLDARHGIRIIACFGVLSQAFDIGWAHRPTTINQKFKWAGNQEAVTVLGYRPTRS
jgi:hypothetical protein